MMQLRISHYFGDVILHFTKSGGMNKQDRYLPLRESEFVALSSVVNEINKQIKKMKKKPEKRDNIRIMKMTTISHKFLTTHAEKKGKQMSCTQQ